MTILEKYNHRFVPSLKKATEEQVKIIGVSIFGSALSFIKHEEPQFLLDFKTDFGLIENRADRRVLNYVMNFVEAYDWGEKRKVTNSDGVKITKDIPKKKVSIDEVIQKIEQIRKDEKNGRENS